MDGSRAINRLLAAYAACRKPAGRQTFPRSVFPNDWTPSTSIETEADSVPALPQPAKDEDLFPKASNANPAVQAAVEHARAQYLRVEGERRSLWPSMDFAAPLRSAFHLQQLPEVLSARKLSANNATVGVAIHLPFPKSRATREGPGGGGGRT